MVASTNSVVLDASALLAYVNGEPGGEVVPPYLERAIISSVNWTEVAQRVLTWGMSLNVVSRDLIDAGLQVLPYERADAEAAAALLLPTKHLGLSLGDRACLALAQRLSLPVLTAERKWGQLSLDLEIRVIR